MGDFELSLNVCSSRKKLGAFSVRQLCIFLFISNLLAKLFSISLEGTERNDI
jgi:hypothetical protein